MRLFRLATNTVHSAGTLLNRARIPTKVVVNDEATVQMEVDAFREHGQIERPAKPEIEEAEVADDHPGKCQDSKTINAELSCENRNRKESGY